MSSITWTPEAIDDLKGISEFIALSSIYYAERTVDNIIAKTTFLEKHPLAGKRVPESGKKYHRELFEGKYRIIYSVRNLPTIEILRIYHSSRILNL